MPLTSASLPLSVQVALAIEKCLMVTSEVGVSPDLPPPPLLSSLRPVNMNPPSAHPPKACVLCSHERQQ